MNKESEMTQQEMKALKKKTAIRFTLILDDGETIRGPKNSTGEYSRDRKFRKDGIILIVRL